jgi:rubrerythrin
MTILTPTKNSGAATKPMPGLYVEPGLQASPDELASFLAGSGLDGMVMGDLLSGMLTHERCGVHLYRSVAGRTTVSQLRNKYEEFGRETERHVEILEQRIAQAGGDPGYISPSARAIEATNARVLESTFMLSGTADLMTSEMAMLDAVFLAETLDHAHWHLLSRIVDGLPEGDLRESFRAAVDEVEEQEDEHVDWARSTKAQLILQAVQNPQEARA